MKNSGQHAVIGRHSGHMMREGLLFPLVSLWPPIWLHDPQSLMTPSWSLLMRSDEGSNKRAIKQLVLMVGLRRPPSCFRRSSGRRSLTCGALCRGGVESQKKPDGGYRLVSIGAVLWRALGSACCRRLRGWTHAWATEELQGGIAERGIHGAHDALIADLEAVGIQTDLRRCFDMVRPFQALDVCAHLGMPAALVPLIADYYVEQRRFLFLEGQADFTRGLQQGCPYSVILVNAVAQVWVAAVKQQVPDVTTRCYLDDRTTWTRNGGQEAAQSLVRAVEAGSVVDLHFGMTVHPDKRACFGTSARVRKHLSRFAASLGSPCSSFKLLGVAYNMVKGRTVPNSEDLTEKIQLRLSSHGRVHGNRTLRRM